MFMLRGYQVATAPCTEPRRVTERRIPMRYEGLMALAIFFVSFPFAPPAFAQQKSKQLQKWEYKTVNSCNSEDRKIDIQQLGEEGWELVSTDVGDCLYYYFKRPKGADSKQVSKQPLQQPTAPQCSVPLDKAPTIRGLRLGMRADELLSLIATNYNSKFRAETVLKNAGAAPNYGLATFGIDVNSDVTKEAKEKFDGISGLDFMTLDGRVVSIRVIYGIGNPRLSTSWTIDEWTAKVSDTFSLPGANNWQSSQNKNLRTLKCKEFEVVASVSTQTNQNLLGVGGSSWTYLTITDPSYRQVIEQRAKSDQEKKQREFVF